MWRMSTANDRHRILVVDDEPSIVDAVATALRYEGYDVEEAYTGRQALDAVTRREPDLIVLDWMLPDIEGIEVGRRLRARGFKSAVLFLTAKDATENKVEALRAGGDDYVTKPFSLAEVVARTQAILRRTVGVLPGDVLRFRAPARPAVSGSACRSSPRSPRRTGAPSARTRRRATARRSASRSHETEVRPNE
jgi:DNA-binding response OmpR family regulator